LGYDPRRKLITLKSKTHKKTIYVPLLLLLSAFLLSQCDNSTNVETKSPKIDLELEKAKFGKLLFFDKRLSVNNSVACITCHDPNKAFTDGEIKSKGVFGRLALRNAPTLLNVKDAPHFMFDGAVPTLEMQAIIPIQDHNEMGFQMGELVEKLRGDAVYAKKAVKLYRRKLDAFVITRSLAAFQRTLISEDSKFDEFVKSNFTKGLSEEEKIGWELFSEKFGCISCHALPHFTSYEMKINHLAKITELDQGRYRITGDSADIGKFKTPTLRNIILTFPYMHDGSINSLEEVLKMYEINRLKFDDSRMKKFQPSEKEKKNIILFLSALTDERHLSE